MVEEYKVCGEVEEKAVKSEIKARRQFTQGLFVTAEGRKRGGTRSGGLGRSARAGVHARAGSAA